LSDSPQLEWARLSVDADAVAERLRDVRVPLYLTLRPRLTPAFVAVLRTLPCVTRLRLDRRDLRTAEYAALFAPGSACDQATLWTPSVRVGVAAVDPLDRLPDPLRVITRNPALLPLERVLVLNWHITTGPPYRLPDMPRLRTLNIQFLHDASSLCTSDALAALAPQLTQVRQLRLCAAHGLRSLAFVRTLAHLTTLSIEAHGCNLPFSEADHVIALPRSVRVTLSGVFAANSAVLRRLLPHVRHTGL
jgi:hypothetical protein